MESTGREAEPLAKGILPVAKQSFRDLFRWEQRVQISVRCQHRPHKRARF